MTEQEKLARQNIKLALKSNNYDPADWNIHKINDFYNVSSKDYFNGFIFNQYGLLITEFTNIENYKTISILSKQDKFDLNFALESLTKAYDEYSMDIVKYCRQNEIEDTKDYNSIMLGRLAGTVGYIRDVLAEVKARNAEVKE